VCEGRASFRIGRWGSTTVPPDARPNYDRLCIGPNGRSRRHQGTCGVASTGARLHAHPAEEGGEVPSQEDLQGQGAESQVRPNPSLQPTCYGWRSQPSQAAELKSLKHTPTASRVEVA